MKIPGKYVRKENRSIAVLKEVTCLKAELRNIKKKKKNFFSVPGTCFPSLFLIWIADVITSAVKTTSVFILIIVH